MSSTDSAARQRTREAVFWRVLADAIEVIADAARADAEAAMIAGDQEKITAKSDDGTVTLGTLTHSDDSTYWRIADDDAYRAWVLARRPDQTVTTVNAMFTKWVLLQAAANDGIVADPETGEMIPGIGQHTRPGTFTMRKTNDARTRARGVVLAILKEIPVALPPSVAHLREELGHVL